MTAVSLSQPALNTQHDSALAEDVVLAGRRDEAVRVRPRLAHRLPAAQYAPDLNPVEGIWSLLRRGPMANAAFTDPDHLAQTLRHGLRHIQL